VKEKESTLEKKRTFAQVLESRRTVIQRDLSKGEKGLSSGDQVQRRKVQRCSRRRKLNNQKSKDKFLNSPACKSSTDMRYQWANLVDLRYKRRDLLHI
jgi:hypothetical protein